MLLHELIEICLKLVKVQIAVLRKHLEFKGYNLKVTMINKTSYLINF